MPDLVEGAVWPTSSPPPAPRPRTTSSGASWPPGPPSGPRSTPGPSTPPLPGRRTPAVVAATTMAEPVARHHRTVGRHRAARVRLPGPSTASSAAWACTSPLRRRRRRRRHPAAGSPERQCPRPPLRRLGPCGLHDRRGSLDRQRRRGPDRFVRSRLVSGVPDGPGNGRRRPPTPRDRCRGRRARAPGSRTGPLRSGRRDPRIPPGPTGPPRVAPTARRRRRRPCPPAAGRAGVATRVSVAAAARAAPPDRRPRPRPRRPPRPRRRTTSTTSTTDPSTITTDSCRPRRRPPSRERGKSELGRHRRDGRRHIVITARGSQARPSRPRWRPSPPWRGSSWCWRACSAGHRPGRRSAGPHPVGATAGSDPGNQGASATDSLDWAGYVATGHSLLQRVGQLAPAGGHLHVHQGVTVGVLGRPRRLRQVRSDRSSRSAPTPTARRRRRTSPGVAEYYAWYELYPVGPGGATDRLVPRDARVSSSPPRCT